ncbi:MAG: VTC domain-containing protein [Myxococcaceae bacterium]
MEAKKHSSMPFAEGEVTRLRREFKWVATLAEANAVCRFLQGDSTEQPALTQVTSVYFDQPDFPLTARAACTPDDCLKIRTKEYFPNRMGQLDHVVFEAKRERHGLTNKQRLWVPRHKLLEVVRAGQGLPPGLLDGGPLLPVLAVAYERRVYQSSAAWRVTVDQSVTWHAISVELAFGHVGLRRELLGPPIASEARVIVEVKHLGRELPEALAALRSRATPFSKFAEGMARLGQAYTEGIFGG